MTSDQLLAELLPFFKAMADGNRLKIIGLLANQEMSVEQLAASLNLSSSTVSHHLSVLTEVGLVSARAESYYNLYKLKANAMEKMAQHVLQSTRQKFPTEGIEAPDFDKKVLRDFSSPDGKLKSIPSQYKKRMVILQHLAKNFQPGTLYTEKQVNEILKQSYPDYATLRRYLVDEGLLAREGGGGSYWRPAAEETSE